MASSPEAVKNFALTVIRSFLTDARRSAETDPPMAGLYMQTALCLALEYDDTGYIDGDALAQTQQEVAQVAAAVCRALAPAPLRLVKKGEVK